MSYTTFLLSKSAYTFTHLHMPNEPQTLRRRNISWAEGSDLLAQQLALQKRMSVSELLERLISAEAGRKRGIAHLHPRNLEAGK